MTKRKYTFRQFLTELAIALLFIPLAAVFFSVMFTTCEREIAAKEAAFQATVAEERICAK